MANNNQVMSKEELVENFNELYKRQEELKEYERKVYEVRRKLKIRGSKKITQEYDVYCSIHGLFNKTMSRSEMQDMTEDIFKNLVEHNIELAERYIETRDNNKYKEAAFKCFMDNPDSLMKLLERYVRSGNGSTYYYYGRLTLDPEQIDNIWNSHKDYLYEKVKLTVHDYYIFYKAFAERLTYEQKDLFVSRIMGRKFQSYAIEILKHPEMPLELRDRLEAYLLSEKLIK